LTRGFFVRRVPIMSAIAAAEVRPEPWVSMLPATVEPDEPPADATGQLERPDGAEPVRWREPKHRSRRYRDDEHPGCLTDSVPTWLRPPGDRRGVAVKHVDGSVDLIADGG
jgi:hypothetical protein